MKGFRSAVSTLEAPELLRRWATTMAFLLAFIAVIEAIVIIVMLPLKEKVPYFLVENQQTGGVEVNKQVGKQFESSDRNKAFYLGKFAKDLLTLDEQTRFRLPESSKVLRGVAQQQWNQWISADKPAARLVADVTLRRSVRFDGSPQFFSATNYSGTMVLWMTLETRSDKDKTPIVKRSRLTVDYAIVPPSNDSEIFDNPIGLYFTSFKIEELN